MRRYHISLMKGIVFGCLIIMTNRINAQNFGNKQNIIMKTTESKFMSDHSEGDHGLEAILDYELSWVLRMAADKECQDEKPYLYHQCRHILFELLGISDMPNITIDSVEVWKQWCYCDVVADVYLSIEGRHELHVILAENKAYTMMKDNQRDNYPKIIKEAYDNYPRYSNYRNYKLHKVLITCFSSSGTSYKQLQQFIEGTDWSIFSVEDLPDWTADNPTESDLFNDFWLNDWKRYE